MDTLHGLGPILCIDCRWVIRRFVRGLEVPQLTEGSDGVESDVGDLRSQADTFLMAQEEREELQVILSAKVDWCPGVVDWRVTRVGSGNGASRSSNDLAKTFDFVVRQEPDLVKGIEPLLVDNDLGCGCTKPNALEHRSHRVESCYGR